MVGSYAHFDKGFAGEEFYSYWEGKQINYVGKIRWTSRLAKAVYIDSSPCIRFVDEDIVQATSWAKPRSVSVIRKADLFDMDQMQFIDYLGT
ncbi:hypothetical protein JOC94_003094 [Bacillus thermophilus]|uniref:Transposase n=1 Tax=Siminovitchia thermophila TaxID=1245522 RepID=A0ABS2RB61_9BACI|nr:hypothetical protein [Siminovitchia thermophila]MBM7716083.1 hypothetical protein [Siminovitchia thermophila]ONK24932.1 hypothetical protein BLX87_01790 [Bacillus sp. VT-16-64]